MTKEDVIRMAREADSGFNPGSKDPLSESVCGLEAIERFAAIVAAAEREACAVTCSLMQESIGGWRKATHDDCAEAIRARSNQ